MADFEETKEMIAAKLATMGIELFDIKHVKAGRHSSLRVFIDKPDGVTIADCARASEELSLMLDVEDFSNHQYNLEVSSPGIDHPLKTFRDFKRAIGREITINLTTPVLEKKFFRGEVTACSEDAVTIDAAGQPVTIPLSHISFGKIEISFK